MRQPLRKPEWPKAEGVLNHLNHPAICVTQVRLCVHTVQSKGATTPYNGSYHLRSHSSIANEAWYWPKHVLRIE